MRQRIIYDVSLHLVNWSWLMPGIVGVVIGLGWLRLTHTAVPTRQLTRIARRLALLLCAVSLAWMVLISALFIYPYLRYSWLLMRGSYQTINGPVRQYEMRLSEFEYGGQFTIGDVDFTYRCVMPMWSLIIPSDCVGDPNVDVVKTGLIKADLAVRVFYVVEATGKPTILRIEYEGLP